MKKTLILFLALQAVLMTVPSFIAPAQALYWEDDYDGNLPSDRKQRPDGFFLFKWIKSLSRKSRESQYKAMDKKFDTGPTVNKGRRAIVLVASGIVGMAVGIAVGGGVSSNPDSRTANMFAGGAVGFGLGVGFGALIMPRDYHVDPLAFNQFMKDRQAFLSDPHRLVIRQAFHATVTPFRFVF